MVLGFFLGFRVSGFDGLSVGFRIEGLRFRATEPTRALRL